MADSLNFVVYMGGCCGDLISALIDPHTAQFKNTTVTFDSDRTRLKKPHMFASDEDKDQYLLTASSKYQSIPSHDLAYHIRKQHKFTGIAVKYWGVALWAAGRFKELHRPHVWAEMTAVCGADTVEGYAQMMIDFSNLIAQHTDSIVTLESICDGTALDNPILQHANKEFYENWLNLQTGIVLP